MEFLELLALAECNGNNTRGFSGELLGNEVGFDFLLTGWGLNPGWGKRFSLLQNAQSGSVTHPASYSMGTGVLSQG
jgi:hypothetical protein